MPDQRHILTEGSPRASADQARTPRSTIALLIVAIGVPALALVVIGVLVWTGTAPASRTPSTSATAPPQNRYGAPVPTNPRDVRPLEANVCGALDPAQWTALNIQPAGRPAER